MKDIQLVITSILFCILQFFNIDFENKVHANNNEILPNWERRHIQELKDIQLNRRDPTDSIEHEHAEFAEFRRRRQKNNKKTTNDKKPTYPKKSTKEGEKKRRKRRRKNTSNKKFFKTTLNEIGTDSKMSDSRDSDRNGKPVDIIVHIKMNE
ncbi:uncharacterized protein LOC123877577 [Maniola jurtina]|uniref:uncharacterized protein LOC123877577 n=1 Tax=Maniola jurtina TaxID=191418 RepID=UPI001E685EA1|nr:uncharacterized protein LOC123877577 [Maniola jurtina]